MFLRLLALIAFLSALAGLVALVAGRGATGALATIRGAFRDHGLAAGAAVTVTAMLGSLFYSELVGYPPCLLCWYQRIAIYPMAIILSAAFLRHLWRSRGEDVAPPTDVWRHVLPLAIIGLPISLYHNLLQRVPSLSSAASCDPDAPCTAIWVDTLGFDLIPLGAFITLLFILVTGVLVLQGRRDEPATDLADRTDHQGAVRA